MCPYFQYQKKGLVCPCNPKAPKDALRPSENGQKVGPLQGPVASGDFQNLRKTLQIILSRMKFSTK